MSNKRLFKKVLSFLFITLLLVSITFPNAIRASGKNTLKVKENPKYIFYFIGDGMGAAQRQLAEYYSKQNTGKKLTMNTLPIAGINTTHSENSLITDSAAAGTALATGHKTKNGMLSKLPNGKDVKTLIEVAEEKDMSTGIITTTRLTHATPAAFASHNVNRSNENEIAVDYLDSGVDFFAGGGLRHFIPNNWTNDEKDAADRTIKSKREDDRNLLEEFKDNGYITFYGKKGVKDFRDYKPKKDDKIFASFTDSHMPYEVDRLNSLYKNNVPTLSQMTQKGIETLSQNKKGFFLMVEGGRIDHASHTNDAVGVIKETIEFDNSVKIAYEFLKKYPKDTLIVVTADHETGGLSLGYDSNYFLKLDSLENVKVSVEDNLLNSYKGDKEKFLNYIGENFGLSNITEQEKREIQDSIDLHNKGVTWGGYSPLAMSVTHILSRKANINWGTYAHTATQVPLSAIGSGAEHLGGYKDNTEVSQVLFKFLDKK
ncbi:alkaline phosphatase III [Gottschalkia purinilytica]|uniref:Alkaline phosphatase III n=1 Tax=Gottschalkia purinilytica TaxID=1503 RepID=A0A0L0WAA4_GOTPU|nr:alkaline phosphatase [Gottschalkia purinilytica]KNF08245.1 alkaline phosphatase III [Gottschalkia purinilytica]